MSAFTAKKDESSSTLNMIGDKSKEEQKIKISPFEKLILNEYWLQN